MYSQIAQQNIITYIYECIGGERKREGTEGGREEEREKFEQLPLIWLKSLWEL